MVRFPFAWRALALGLLALLVGRVAVLAQGQSPDPIFRHQACTGNCVADIVFLHSGQGDSMAENSYHAWFTEYYIHTGCGDSLTRTSIEFLIDVVADVVGAPGGSTLQCWQGLGALGSLCNSTCSDYWQEDGAYAPNVRLSLLDGGQGYAEVKADNATNAYLYEGLPERAPNAYSREFSLYTTLQYEDGPELLVHRQEMPSLSFPNWITRGGWDDCVQQYSAGDARCKLLSHFTRASEAFSESAFGSGALYDLSGQTSDGDDVRGSAEDGYLKLATDDATVTIDQGAYAGFTYVWTHNKSQGTYTEQVAEWNAGSGAVTFTNSECNSWYCGIFNDRVDRDTYIFAVQGPEARMLLGDYHVAIEARLAHDRDQADNRVGYDYAVSGPPPTPTPGPTPLDLSAVTIRDVGPGEYAATVAPGETLHLYRVNVPPACAYLQVYLEHPTGTTVSLFTDYGQPPVPSYPTLHLWEYDCWDIAADDYGAYCGYTRPAPGSHYLAVIPFAGDGAYTLRVQLIQGATATPTPIPSSTPLPPDGSGGTGGSGSGGGLAGSQVEQEPNDEFDQATPWDVSGSMRGKLNTRSDQDRFVFSGALSGIYKITLSDVPANISPDLYVYRASHTVAASRTDAADGEDVTLGIDLNQGETFFIKVRSSYGGDVSEQDYTLSAEFIPDPLEPNDDLGAATAWDAFSAPVYGYFYERVSGPGDVYTFTVPSTAGGVLLTVDLAGVPQNVGANLYLYKHTHTQVASSSNPPDGQPLSLTIDANPGEAFYVNVRPDSRLQTSESPYVLSVSTLADPDEPNDAFDQATAWDYTTGPVRGYFAEQVSGPADYYRFSVPAGSGSAPLTLRLKDVPATVEPNLAVYNSRKHRVASDLIAAAGASIALTFDVEPGATYYVKVYPDSRFMVSPEPYTLVVEGYEAAGGGPAGALGATGGATQDDGTDTVTVAGLVYQGADLSGGTPLAGADLYARIGGGATQRLGASDSLGLYAGSLSVPGGASVEIWAERQGYAFAPALETWTHATGPELRVIHFLATELAVGTTPTPTPSPTAPATNRVVGRVSRPGGEGIPGVQVFLQTGTSDALQVLGPTGPDGAYGGDVILPDGIQVRVWAEKEGMAFTPPYHRFFHEGALQERWADFVLAEK